MVSEIYFNKVSICSIDRISRLRIHRELAQNPPYLYFAITRMLNTSGMGARFQMVQCA